MSDENVIAPDDVYVKLPREKVKNAATYGWPIDAQEECRAALVEPVVIDGVPMPRAQVEFFAENGVDVTEPERFKPRFPDTVRQIPWRRFFE